MAEEKEVPTLPPEESVVLFKKGREAWNKWVEENPEYNIDFLGVDFSKHRDEDRNLTFGGFKFPKGLVRFEKTNFGSGDVSFMQTEFGDGHASFKDAQFGEGYVNFAEAKFGEGDVCFFNAKFGDGGFCFSYAELDKGAFTFIDARFGEGEVTFIGTQFGDGDVKFGMAKFGDGEVSFSKAHFGDGNVSFYEAQFGKGDIFFRSTNFGDGNVSFVRARFGNGQVNFRNALFSDGNVSFKNAVFCEGHVSFVKAQFGKGYVSFARVLFGEGDVSFSGAHFGKGKVSFNDAQFGDSGVNFERVLFEERDVRFKNCQVAGHFNFRSLREPVAIGSISLRGATFEKTFDISNNVFDCVPDLTNIKTTNQVALDNFTCAFETKPVKQPILGKWAIEDDVATDVDDRHRLRRLKELAEANKNHKQALELHAMEMRATRWQEGTSKWDNLIDLAYDKVSDYGRSELTPFNWLVGVWLVWTAFYAGITWSKNLLWYNHIAEALSFSLGQLLPIIPGSRVAQTEGIQILFGGNLPVYVTLMAFIQTLVSLVLIFLIGLALRNRFRI